MSPLAVDSRTRAEQLGYKPYSIEIPELPGKGEDGAGIEISDRVVELIKASNSLFPTLMLHGDLDQLGPAGQKCREQVWERKGMLLTYVLNFSGRNLQTALELGAFGAFRFGLTIKYMSPISERLHAEDKSRQLRIWVKRAQDARNLDYGS